MTMLDPNQGILLDHDRMWRPGKLSSVPTYCRVMVNYIAFWTQQQVQPLALPDPFTTTRFPGTMVPHDDHCPLTSTAVGL